MGWWTTRRAGLLLAATCTAAGASDLPFPEALNACQLVAKPHSFQLLIVVSEAEPAVAMRPSSAFVNCLAHEARGREQNGTKRRNSLISKLDSAIPACTGRHGSTANFPVDYTLVEKGAFELRLPSENETAACIVGRTLGPGR